MSDQSWDGGKLDLDQWPFFKVISGHTSSHPLLVHNFLQKQDNIMIHEWDTLFHRRHEMARNMVSDTETLKFRGISRLCNVLGVIFVIVSKLHIVLKKIMMLNIMSLRSVSDRAHWKYQPLEVRLSPSRPYKNIIASRAVYCDVPSCCSQIFSLPKLLARLADVPRPGAVRSFRWPEESTYLEPGVLFRTLRLKWLWVSHDQ